MGSQISVGYFKQGDDFHHALRHTDSVPAALIAWAENLEHSAKNIRRIASVVADYPNVEGDGDTHWAAVHGLPEEVERQLISDGVLMKDPFEDEYVEEDDPE